MPLNSRMSFRRAFPSPILYIAFGEHHPTYFIAALQMAFSSWMTARREFRTSHLPRTRLATVAQCCENRTEPSGLRQTGWGWSKCTREKQTISGVKDGLSSSNVWAIYQDPEKSLWLGTDRGSSGAKMIKPFIFTETNGIPHIR